MNNDIDKDREQGEVLPHFLPIVQGYLWGINGSPIRDIKAAMESSTLE